MSNNLEETLAYGSRQMGLFENLRDVFGLAMRSRLGLTVKSHFRV